jgi:glycosyltransferase involved in cell wall biosynthesis
MTIAVCVPIKNRYKVRRPDKGFNLLYPRCLTSVLEIERPDIELVVLDWASDDEPVAGWLAGRHPGKDPHILEYAAPGFNRGQARNILADYALDTMGATHLLFLDADVTVSGDAVDRMARAAERTGCAVFPICRRHTDPAHTVWREMTNSHGTCFVAADVWRAHKLRWPAADAAWGSEDGQFAERCKALGIYDRMPAHPGLWHLWHPNDRAWKDRFVRGAA